MLSKVSVSRTSWTLGEQGVVSAGTLALNILLARALPPAEYGVFALLYGGLMTLQLFNGTLLFHPLAVRLVVTPPHDQPRLLRATYLLVLALSTGMGLSLTAVLVAFGRYDLVLPALAFFVAWQVQEAMRRGLLTGLRHKAAVPGDVAGYLGQAALVATLVWLDALTLVSALYAMAAAAALAAPLHAWRLTLRSGGPLRLRETVLDYWQVGGFWALGNGMLTQVRGQGLPWILAVIAGPAAAGGFQAVSTIANFVNPLIIGLGNLVPQLASKASGHGNRHAWRAVRPYAVISLVGVLGFSVVVFSLPGLVLELFFGAQSPYAAMTAPLRILIAGGLAFCVAETILAYLHGVSQARLAFFVNAVGALLVMVLAWPLIAGWGLSGACLVAAAAHVVRLGFARLMLARTMRADGRIVPLEGPAASAPSLLLRT